jgi:hypothetical protein
MEYFNVSLQGIDSPHRYKDGKDVVPIKFTKELLIKMIEYEVLPPYMKTSLRNYYNVKLDSSLSDFKSEIKSFINLYDKSNGNDPVKILQGVSIKPVNVPITEPPKQK